MPTLVVPGRTPFAFRTAHLTPHPRCKSTPPHNLQTSETSLSFYAINYRASLIAGNEKAFYLSYVTNITAVSQRHHSSSPEGGSNAAALVGLSGNWQLEATKHEWITWWTNGFTCASFFHTGVYAAKYKQNKQFPADVKTPLNISHMWQMFDSLLLVLKLELDCSRLFLFLKWRLISATWTGLQTVITRLRNDLSPGLYYSFMWIISVFFWIKGLRTLWGPDLRFRLCVECTKSSAGAYSSNMVVLRPFCWKRVKLIYWNKTDRNARKTNDAQQSVRPTQDGESPACRDLKLPSLQKWKA